MKMNNLTIISLLNILNNYSNKRLPQKISYAITKNIMAIEKEYNVYTEQLNKIINAYSDYIEKDSNGNVLTEKNGIPKICNESKKAHFTEEINDLLNIELDINLFTIDEEAFNYDDSDKYACLTPIEIIQLQNILCINN